MISRSYLTGWGVGEKLTSAQMNALDINVTYALDKRAGQTDTLASLVTLAGIGRIVQAPAVGPDADTTYLASGPNRSVVLTSAITADRTYTLSHTDAVDGDTILMYSDGTFAYTITVKDGVTTIGGVGANAATGASWAEFVFRSGAWKQQRTTSGILAVIVDWTASGSFTFPANALSYAIFEGCGGGGGGGGGGAGAGVTTPTAGGGGGGGAIRSVSVSAMVPGAVYNVTIPNAAPGGTSGVPGQHGGDVTCVKSVGGTVVCKRAGGQGGNAGATATNPAYYQYGLGGLPTKNTRMLGSRTASYESATNDLYRLDLPQCGVAGTVAQSSSHPAAPALVGASDSPEGFQAGAYGTAGTQLGSAHGGGRGGGGGAGPYGDGGNGGNGGNGNNAGPGGVGGAGSAPATANSGAGGGGGGAGGNGSTPVAGGAGGAGGQGRLRIVYFIP